MKKQLLKNLIVVAGVFLVQQAYAQNWLTKGNNSTKTDTLGSITNQDVNIITNNTSRIFIQKTGNVGIGIAAPAYKLDVSGDANINGVKLGKGGGSVGTNTVLGVSTLANNTTGIQNTANGYQAISSNTTGGNNTASGYQSLLSNTGGSYNTGFGSQSLKANTSGQYNVAVGGQSLYANTTGSKNTAVGMESLKSDISGAENTAVGYRSLWKNKAGSNTSIGAWSSYLNINGSNNTAIGYKSLFSNITSGNTAIGSYALTSNTEGTMNTATGDSALFSNVIGYGNTATGYQSLYSNVGTFHPDPELPYTDGIDNTANGAQALYNNISGANNIAVGSQALYSNTVGTANVAIGVHALYSNNSYFNTASGDYALSANISGSNNVAVGTSALGYGVSGNSNTANGYSALANNTGDFNTASGSYALYNNTGSYNTATGKDALLNNTTSTGCTANGYQSLLTNTSGINNTGIGTYADVSSGSFNNATAVGYQALVDASDKVRIGNSLVSSYSCQVNWTAGSDARIKDNVQENIHGLDFINELRPVTFHYNIDKQNALMGIKNDESLEGKKAIEKIAFSGFLAQEVDAAAQKVGYDFSGVDKSGKVMGLRYSEFTVPLVKGMQELSAENKIFKEEIQKLKEENLKLKQTVSEMKSCVESICENSTLKNSTSAITTESNKLFQNQPNPFNQSTVIGYQLMSDSKNASIVIRNLNGELLKTVTLAQTGKGQVTINANELSQGTYTYTLIINNQSVDTKLMVITK